MLNSTYHDEVRAFIVDDAVSAMTTATHALGLFDAFIALASTIVRLPVPPGRSIESDVTLDLHYYHIPSNSS